MIRMIHRTTKQDISVEAVDSGGEHLVRLIGVEYPDYLTVAESRQLARELIAASDEPLPPKIEGPK